MKQCFLSNYVPAEIAMYMKEEDKNREFIGMIDDYVYDSGNTIQKYN